MALFKQGQKIEVIVRKEDSNAATAGANDESAEKSGTGAEQAGQDGAGTTTEGRSKVNKRITATKVLAAGIAAGRLYVNYIAGGVAYRNGDDAEQEAVQRNFEMAEEAIGLAASVGIGATYGIRGGAPGAVIGAVLALATTATSLGFKYAGKYREYNAKVFKEENGIEYLRARSQVSLTTGRLR